MSLKIFHTADLHLGMAFKNRHYPEAVRQQLVEARYQALKQLVELANEARCQLFWWLETFFTGRGCLAKLLPG